jgi:hypothetical protein
VEKRAFFATTPYLTDYGDFAVIRKGSIMASYKIPPATLMSFSDPGKPFLSFDQFLNVVQWFRDNIYALEHIQNYTSLAGKEFTMWTVRQESSYHQHIWFDQLDEDLELSFEVLPLDRNSSFSLKVELRLSNGDLCFRHTQELAVEKMGKNGFRMTSWKKVPEIRDFLLMQVSADQSRTKKETHLEDA